jgi:hypothetical protein
MLYPTIAINQIKLVQFGTRKLTASESESTPVVNLVVVLSAITGHATIGSLHGLQFGGDTYKNGGGCGRC